MVRKQTLFASISASTDSDLFILVKNHTFLSFFEALANIFIQYY